MSSPPPDIVDSIEVDSSFGSETLLTPPSTITNGSVYSRQHNVTPTPEPQILGIREALGDLRLSDHVSEPEEENLVAGINQLEIHGGRLSEADSDNDDLGYNVRAESLPDAPIYDARLQGAIRATKIELRQLYSIMRRYPMVSDTASTINALAQQTQRLSAFDYPRTRTIGLVGDSGVGKSSLINSLLDEECIAKSSSDGGACTNIVTEYRYLAHTQEGSYRFEIDYMSSEEVKVLLEDLISSYRAYHTNAFQEIRSLIEQEAVRDRAVRSAAALKSLFGDSSGYSEEILLRGGPNASQEIFVALEQMVRNVQQRRPGGLTASTWSGTADTVEDLTSQLDVFIRDRSQDDFPVIWPFIGIIRVYLRSLFLRTGIILADLPGLRDLNYARVRATDRYLRTCHEVFAVAKIDRATTDVGVKDIISRCGQRPVRIVCTHSEAVNAMETERSCPEDAPQIKKLRSVTTPLDRELKRLQRERRQKKGSVPASAHAAEVRVSDELQQARFNLDSFLVHRRNAKVRRALQLEYSKKVFNEDLQVFCISNKEYSKYKDEELTMARPRVELSGVPVLRQYCHLIPAAAQFEAVAVFLERQVPTLLGSIRQWLLQGSDGLTAGRADTVREALETSKSHFLQWNVLISALEQNLKREFRKTILGPMEQSAARWSREAVNTSRVWASWHHSTYAAFCRAYGDYSTSLVGYHNWNDEIVSAMREDLEPHWTRFIQEARDGIDDTVGEISKIFDTEENNLITCLGFAPNAIGNLVTNLNPRMSCIEDLIYTTRDDFVEKTRLLQNEALGGYPSSYITELMRSTYMACKNESGKGSDARRKDHISRRLSGPGLFMEARRLVRDAQPERIGILIEEIRNGLEAEFGQLFVDIQNVVCEEGEVNESQRHPETAHEMQSMVDDLAQELEDHRSLLSQLRQGVAP